MALSSLITDYLGSGLFSAMPTTPPIPSNGTAVFTCTDTSGPHVGQVYVWNGVWVLLPIPGPAGETGPAGPTGPPGPSGSGGGSSFSVAQTAHGFTTGEAVYFNGTTWALAEANSDLTLGVAIVSVVDANNFNAFVSGEITGLMGLTAGQFYFVSDTVPGALTLTEPTASTSFSNPILLALSSITGVVLPYRASGTTGGSSSGGSSWPFTNLTPPTISGWEWLNQASATANLSNGILTISDPGNAGANIRYFYSPTPLTSGGTWDVAVGIGITSDVYLGTAYNWFDGIAISDGTKFVVFGWDHQNSVASGHSVLSILQYSNVSTFSGGTGWNWSPWAAGIVWLRIHNDGTHRTYYVATDPVNIGWTQVYQEPSATFLSEVSVGWLLNLYDYPLPHTSDAYLSWEQT